MVAEAAYGGYLLGKPGMVATHSFGNSRQSTLDSVFINKTANNLIFGTAALVDPATGNIARADVASGVFLGVFEDPEKYADVNYYSPKERVTVKTSGDIWVFVDPAITIIPLVGTVYYIPTAGATLGYFTNSATNNVALPGSARFLTPNHNGAAILSLNVL